MNLINDDVYKVLIFLNKERMEDVEIIESLKQQIAILKDHTEYLQAQNDELKNRIKNQVLKESK